MSVPAGFFNGAVTQQRQSATAARVAENSPRLATHTHRATSNGIGRIRVTDPVVFTCPFLEEPTVLNGYAIISGPTNLTAWHDPNGGAQVRAWVRNSRGHYTGALISLWVDCAATGAETAETAPSGVRSTHYLTFAGQAYKALDAASVLEAQTVAVREVTFS